MCNEKIKLLNIDGGIRREQVKCLPRHRSYPLPLLLDDFLVLPCRFIQFIAGFDMNPISNSKRGRRDFIASTIFITLAN